MFMKQFQEGNSELETAVAISNHTTIDRQASVERKKADQT
jgi:hypothetical protein